jgi:carbonic anhydrase/acetyltransferase-like protein (isoleucine patch superfamily)
MIGSVDGGSPVIGPGAWVAPGAVVVGRVTLGQGASVWYGSVLRADTEEILVGADSNIQDLCCLHVDEGEPAVLADRVSLGHRAVVHGAQVDAGALIGIGAIVLGRARVGAGTLVAAGALCWRARPGGPRADRRRPGRLCQHAGALPGAGRPARGRRLGLTRRVILPG